MSQDHLKLLDQRRRDILMTRRQRRHITDLLRDGYDEAYRDADDEPFSLSLYTNDLDPLTPQNERYLRDGQADTDYQKLFGVIAVKTEFSIDTIGNDTVISLSHDI